MTKKLGATLFLLAITCTIFSQTHINGIIADSISKQHLPFSSIKIENTKAGLLSDINGRFSIIINPSNTSIVIFSYTGYYSKKIDANTFQNNDTIFLSRKSTQLKEVVIGSNSGKIRRIINNAIANKYNNNPDNYNKYECNVYYKMKIDMANFPQDSFHIDQKTKKKIMDSVREKLPDFLTPKSYLMFAESYTKRMYKKQGQLNEIVLASRFSGLKKTYFINTVTEVLPFHIYNDYIKLNNVDYTSPIAKGWQTRYKFTLEEELYLGGDTTYLLSFQPKKNAVFNSLQGLVYINKNGYAISHMIASIADTSKDWTISFEQVYNLVDKKWFPKELNYTFIIKKIFSPKTQMFINGHSIVDSIFFDQPFSRKMDKAHPIKLSDSVDLKTESDWAHLRLDSISHRELNTYTVLDSFTKKNHLETILTATSKLTLNKLALGKYDLDLTRILRSNEYEGVRLGLGLYTNNKVSKYFSVGGWAAYGFKDHKFKGGTSFTLFPKKEKDDWLNISVQHDYRKPGLIYLFDDLYKNSGLNWVLRAPDEITEYKLSAQKQMGYTQINPEIIKTNLTSSPRNIFIDKGISYNNFKINEGNIGIRYAYGEKRMPVMDYYVPLDTKFPILYSRISYGQISSNDYKANFTKLIAAVTYQHHINRWGLDGIKIEGGLLKEQSDKALPRSFLFATNGIRTQTFSYYFQDGFVTIPPNLFFADKYVNLFYRHDFDKFFWKTKVSKPYLSLLHNIGSGSISNVSNNANNGVSTYSKPYHESGVLINQFYKYNLHLAEIGFNIGAFYHWSNRPDLKTNTTIVFSAGIAL